VEIGTLSLLIEYSVDPVFVISTNVDSHTASIGKILVLRASKTRSGAEVVT
jgi:hypothetical protein